MNILSHGVQPCIQRSPQVAIAERCVRAATFCMPTYNYLFHLHVGNGILDDRRCADIICMHAIRDIAMHEDVARLAVAHGRLWDAAICTSYPQDLGPLALCEFGKGSRIGFGRFLRVYAVSGYDAVDGI
jgi:hypothetical protein